MLAIANHYCNLRNSFLRDVYNCTSFFPNRYECQQDNSVIGEDQFTHDSDWLKKQINGSLEFWRGEREARFTPEEERWKCRVCQFASICPANANLGTTGISSPTNYPK